MVRDDNFVTGVSPVSFPNSPTLFFSLPFLLPRSPSSISLPFFLPLSTISDLPFPSMSFLYEVPFPPPAPFLSFSTHPCTSSLLFPGLLSFCQRWWQIWVQKPAAIFIFLAPCSDGNIWQSLTLLDPRSKIQILRIKTSFERAKKKKKRKKRREKEKMKRKEETKEREIRAEGRGFWQVWTTAEGNWNLYCQVVSSVRCYGNNCTCCFRYGYNCASCRLEDVKVSKF